MTLPDTKYEVLELPGHQRTLAELSILCLVRRRLLREEVLHLRAKRLVLLGPDVLGPVLEPREGHVAAEGGGGEEGVCSETGRICSLRCTGGTALRHQVSPRTKYSANYTNSQFLLCLCFFLTLSLIFASKTRQSTVFWSVLQDVYLD